MSTAHVVLVAIVLYVVVAFGWRSWLQYRRTGSTGFRGVSGRILSAEWWGGVLLVVGLVASFTAPLLDIVGVGLGTLRLPSTLGPAIDITGAVVLVAGFAGTVTAQLTMGASWRIGVDASERTALVTHGLFSLVRNPIFTSMLLMSAGVALLVPSAIAIGGFVVALVGLEVQVRVVEEPYLLRLHPAYAAYAARTGRFIPRFGRLSA